MAGLLKQLQKPKSRLGLSVGEVLASPENGAGQAAIQPTSSQPAKDQLPEQTKDVPGGEEAVSRIKQAKEAVSELAADPLKVTEILPKPDGRKKTATGKRTKKVEKVEKTREKIVRRKKSASPAPALVGQYDDKLPWWVMDTKKTSPQVEVLVPEARKMLNEILPSDGSTPIDLPQALKQAVELTAEVMGSEIRISEKDKDQAYKELLSLLTGKGPLQAVYDDPAVTDVFIDSHKAIKVIRRGQAMETPFYFRSKEEYKAFINGMLQTIDRVLNLSSPIVDCVLDDGYRSRVNAIDSSVIDGDEPRVCIRIPRLQRVSFYDILQSKTLPATVAAWLAEVTATGDANILVMGPTGSGKTVFTTALLSTVSSDERIITIEDVPEIFIPTAHLEKLVSRPPNAQGEGEIKMPDLLRAALRRAPHRIVVGEIRDEEGRLFLRALETGHAGSIATIHAESSRDGLWRLLDVVAAYEKAPQESIMRRIARSVDLTITTKKIDGRPCMIEISEVKTPVDGEFVVQSLVKFDSEVNGKRQWRLMAQNSKWMDRIKKRGLQLKTGPGLLPMEQPESS